MVGISPTIFRLFHFSNLMSLATKVVIVHLQNNFPIKYLIASTTARAFDYFIGYQLYCQTLQDSYNLETMAVAFTRLLDPAYREHPTHRPYAGPASAFLKSPPPSALPWPKSIKSSTLESKSRITGSPHTPPTGPFETGKPSNAISPHSAHEITITGGEITKRYLSHAQTEDQRAARDTQHIKPTNNISAPPHKVDKYGRIQSLGRPLEVWERRSAQKDTTSPRSHFSTGELPHKPMARKMDQNWRTPVVEDQTAIHAKPDSDDDDRTLVNEDTKNLVDEDEARPDFDSKALIKHEELYVYITLLRNGKDANGSRSILPATARVAVDIEICVEVCKEKSRLDEDDIGKRGEEAMVFMGTVVIGLLLALGGLESL